MSWLVAVMGPTGSGKSSLAEKLAAETGAQLVNADAFQVYQGLDIGTNKPTNKSKYELLDLCEPTHKFSLGEWLNKFYTYVDNWWKTQTPLVIVGGTGLYVRALLEGYDDLHGEPDQELRERLMEREAQEGLTSLFDELTRLQPIVAEKIDANNPIRVRRALERALDPKPLAPRVLPYEKKLKLGLFPNVETLDRSLNARIETMWERGWPAEVDGLLRRGIPRESPGFRAIGYQEIADYLEGLAGEQETKEKIFLSTRQYAKRQRTWLRREPNLLRFESGGSDNAVLDRVLAALR